MMNISQVIERLEEIKKTVGDIPVVTEADHEYWGTLYYHITEHTIRVTEHAQPDGPKSGKEVLAVTIGNDY